MVSFLASKSSSREGIACTDMHAAKMETSTKVTDVQTNGSLHFLGKTSITLQKLCKHWGYNDRHWFSCGFSLQYMGPRLYQRSDYLHFNLHRVKFKIQKCFSNGRWPLWFPAISQISPPGLVPEKDGYMRLIHHLFYAENLFINQQHAQCSVIIVIKSTKEQNWKLKLAWVLKQQQKREAKTDIKSYTYITACITGVIMICLGLDFRESIILTKWCLLNYQQVVHFIWQVSLFFPRYM